MNSFVSVFTNRIMEGPARNHTRGPVSSVAGPAYNQMVAAAYCSPQIVLIYLLVSLIYFISTCNTHLVDI